MKKIYLLSLLSFLLCEGFSQICITEEVFLEEAKKNPALLQERQAYDEEISKAVDAMVAYKVSAVPKIIPVVVHIIHDGGVENISKAQVYSQIDALNADFRKLNADTANIPGPFQPLAGDANIEFKLAQLDPNGNCTDGIIRVKSELTNNARNNVKALSYWPSNKYLNMWIVKNIENTGGSPGIIIGFAQFPGGAALTDGVVMKYDFFGTVGNANPSNKGRTTTHEIGHWLNLRHIWGDALCGDDNVADTPQQEGMNFSTCPSFPKNSNCPGNGVNGDMYMNYMDYTVGNCQNMFSVGQATRMNAALNSPVSGRSNLWSSANLIDTGTDGSAPVTCPPIASFYYNTSSYCEGATVNYSDDTYNSDPTSWDWTLTGGMPSSSTDENPTVVYPVAGVYDVSLTSSNSAGSDSKTENNFIEIFPLQAPYAYPFTEDMENINFPSYDWRVENSAPNTTTWEVTNAASFSGSQSLRINNYIGNAQGSTDAFITPSIDLTNLSLAYLHFKLAFAPRSSTSTDRLVVYVSTTCGRYWTSKYTKAGAALATAPVTFSNYIPTASEWEDESVNIASSTFSGKPNVKFKFEYSHDTGNNIYIDDINLTGTWTSIDEIEQAFDINLYPNPAENVARLSFTTEAKNKIVIKVYDVTGREISTVADEVLAPGEYHIDIPEMPAKGTYVVKLFVGEREMSRKLLIQ